MVEYRSWDDKIHMIQSVSITFLVLISCVEEDTVTKRPLKDSELVSLYIDTN
jgi:hypothetical protein